jgi:hypothetical protein
MRVSTLSLAAVLAISSIGAAARAQSTPDHATSRAYNRALGVECEHCHTSVSFADASKPAFDFARRMERMARGISDGPLKARGGVTCWTCHRGHTIPARLPRADWESIATEHAADLAGGREGLSLAMSVYAASLGVACAHCHASGDWKDASKPAHQAVAVMGTIFDLIPTYFDPAVRMPRTQCYMCHQGHVRVER